MGYFRRKPRRRSERAFKESLHTGAPLGPVALTRPATFREWRYVRLAVPAWHWDTGQGQGIFRACGAVQETRRLEPEQWRRLRRLLLWFGANLRKPRLTNAQAIFWFKLNALACRRRVKE